MRITCAPSTSSTPQAATRACCARSRRNNTLHITCRQRGVKTQAQRGTRVGSWGLSWQLVRALAQQAAKEAGPWVEDLVAPVVMGSPQPLPGLRSPEDLADKDSQFVEVHGVRLHYKQVLPPGGATHDTPMILLLHGFNGSTFNWRDVMQPLSRAALGPLLPTEGCRVVAFDRPPFGLTQRVSVSASNSAAGGGGGGGGSSATPANPYTNEGAADLAAGLVDALGARRAVVVGHSAGAAVALAMAERHPECVQGLVFVCPALPDDSGRLLPTTLGAQLRLGLTRAILAQDEAGINYVRRVINKRAEAVKRGDLGPAMRADGPLAQEVVDGYLLPMQAEGWDFGMLQLLRSFSVGSAPDYSRVAVPVLFVQGERDEPLASLARKVHGIFERTSQADVRYVELPGIGHIPQEEAPQVFAGVLVEWLSEAFISDAGENRVGAAPVEEAGGQGSKGADGRKTSDASIGLTDNVEDW